VAKMATKRQHDKNKNWMIQWRWHEERFVYSTKTTDQKKANSDLKAIEILLDKLERSYEKLPEDLTYEERKNWFLEKANLAKKSKPASAGIHLSAVCKLYLESQKVGGKAENSIATETTHLRRFRSIIGESISLDAIGRNQIVDYVKKRKVQTWAGKPTQEITIRKELATVLQLYGYANNFGHTAKNCPVLGDSGKWIVNLKGNGHKNFETYDRLTKRKTKGESVNWRKLFLTLDEIEDVIAFVKERDVFGWMYSAVMLAAYSGMRRSELRRSLPEDFDFAENQITVREKKRVRTTKESFRYVPVHKELKPVLKTYLENHSGKFTFEIQQGVQISPKRMHLALKNTMKFSDKWKMIRWHHFRHAFASNCLRAGIPSEQIGLWCGHTTAEMRDLYQHVFPSDGPIWMDKLSKEQILRVSKG
jgi:integrase